MRKKKKEITSPQLTVGKNNVKLTPSKLFPVVSFLPKAGAMCYLVECKGGASTT